MTRQTDRQTHTERERERERERISEIAGDYRRVYHQIISLREFGVIFNTQQIRILFWNISRITVVFWVYLSETLRYENPPIPSSYEFLKIFFFQVNFCLKFDQRKSRSTSQFYVSKLFKFQPPKHLWPDWFIWKILYCLNLKVTGCFFTVVWTKQRPLGSFQLTLFSFQIIVGKWLKFWYI